MPEKPLSVAIAALINENKILLQKRKRGDYVGLWGLPGGKIELGEHLCAAVKREIKEETGIQSTFIAHRGFVSELLLERGEVQNHFLLHLCELKPESSNVISTEEGTTQWFELSTLETMKEQIIPSDYLMIEKFIQQKGKNYYDCVMEKVGDVHFLRKFE
ncbi:MAG: NUDIX domain-containing protein [Nanoarchaeota archaeon]|nr:NUDIX domain-containing protein [Nanoarchaeota archaeon]